MATNPSREQWLTPPFDSDTDFPESVQLAADDHDVVDFCRTCAFANVCRAVGYGNSELNALHCLVEHVGPFRAGEFVFRDGHPFRAIFAVRAGTVKTFMVDHDGREQVLGFHLPGEVIGLNAIYADRFPCNAVALEEARFCRLSFPAMSALASQRPAVQKHLFQMLSKEIGAVSLLAGDHRSDERVAAFLTDLSERYAARGFSAQRFHFSMSRTDIANYLRLASETVSRVLTRFRSAGLIEIDGRELIVLDANQLRGIGQSLLPN